jgi:hypothetical protein
MSLAKQAMLLLAAALGGCIVVHDEPRHVYRAPPPPPPAPPPATTVVWTEEEEVHYVVYREYFGCTEEEVAFIPHYRRYYACTDDEIYFCWFVSRRCGLSFDVCWRSYYYDCGRSCDRLVVYYRAPREQFFVAVGPGVAYPPVYQRSYACYHSGNYASVTFTNQEYVALVHMKVGVEYQGHTSTTYFTRVNECGGNTSRVVVQSRDSCGRGGTTVTGVAVQKTAPRPWTMPPQQKQTWQQSHQAQVTRSETSFKEVHKEQVQKAQPQAQQRPAAGGAPERRDDRNPGRAPAQGGNPNPPAGKGGEAEHNPKAPAKGPDQPPPPKSPRDDEKPKGDKGKGEDKGKDEGKKGDK